MESEAFISEATGKANRRMPVVSSAEEGVGKCLVFGWGRFRKVYESACAEQN